MRWSQFDVHWNKEGFPEEGNTESAGRDNELNLVFLPFSLPRLELFAGAVLYVKIPKVCQLDSYAVIHMARLTTAISPSKNNALASAIEI